MKACKKDGCNYPVFSHLYCKNHQYLRNDNKKPKPMNNHQVTPLNPSQLTEMALFRMIWDKSDKKSFITGVWLRDYLATPLWPNCFMHVLAKGQNKWPHFKYYAKNISLGTPLEHSLWDDGTEEARLNYSLEIEEASGGRNKADWQKLKDLEVELLKEYKLYFPTTKGMIIGVRYSGEEVYDTISHLNRVYFDSLKK